MLRRRTGATRAALVALGEVVTSSLHARLLQRDEVAQADSPARESLNEDRINHEWMGQYTLYAQQHWRTMLRRYKVEPARVEPSVLLRVTDNWVEYTLRYVVDYKQRRVTRDAIFRLILQRVEETQGTVRLASATYEIVGLPGVEIDLTSGGKALQTK